MKLDGDDSLAKATTVVHNHVVLETDRLCSKHDLSQERVLAILKKTVIGADYSSPAIEYVAGLPENEPSYSQPVVFCPSLSSCLGYLNPDMALTLFETEDRSVLLDLELGAEFLCDKGEKLFFIMADLESLLEEFITYLQRNRVHLERTGYPQTSFEPSFWFQSRFTRLYWTKESDSRSSLRTKDGSRHKFYGWVQEYDEDGYAIACSPAPHPEIIDERTDSTPDKHMTAKKGWHDDGMLYYYDLPETCFDDYDRAPTMPGFSTEDANRLRTDRHRMLQLQITWLDEILTATVRRCADGLWERCLGELTKQLTAADVDFYVRMDQLYYGSRHIPGSPEEDGGGRSGGLSDMFALIGYVETELRLGSVSKTVETFSHMFLRNERRRSYFLPFDNYYHAIAEIGRHDIDRLLTSYDTLARHEPILWSSYVDRVRDALENEFYENVTIQSPVKRRYSRQYQSHVASYGEWFKIHLETCGIMPRLSPPDSSYVTQFPPMENLRWEEVTITFISNDVIRVSARRKKRDYHFAKIGFEDGRKAERPDTRWLVLKRLAELGEISWRADVDQKTRDKAKSAIRDIRPRLRRLIDISDDPFHKYKKKHGYKPKFTLRIRDAKPPL